MSGPDHLGVQPRPYRALLRALLYIELRNETYGQATKSEARSTVPPLYWVLGQFLATSLLTSMLLFMRTDAWFFTLAGLVTSSVLLFSCLVVEFHDVVLDPADADVIGHRPITARTVGAARLTNLTIFVGVMTIATTIFPAVIGAAQYDAPSHYLPAYVLSSGLVSLATTAIVILLYTTLGAGRFLDDGRHLFAWVQILGILAVFYGGQLMLRDSNGSVEHLAARPPEWLRWLPHAILADLVSGTPRSLFPFLPGIVGATLGTALLAFVAVLRAGSAWAKVNAGALAARRSEATGEALAGTTRPAGSRAHARPEGAVYWLVRVMLRRDRELQLRTWPAFGVVLAVLVLGIATGQLAQPSAGATTATVLTFTLHLLLASAVPVLYQNVAGSRDHEASWLLEVAPSLSPGAVRAGLRSALRRTFFLPVLLALWVVLGVAWRAPLEVALFVSISALLLELAVRLCEAYAPYAPPLSRPPARGSATSQVSIATITVALGGVTVAGLEWSVAHRPLGQVVVAASLGAALLGLARASRRERERGSSSGGGP